jgi:hypothetical protein
MALLDVDLPVGMRGPASSSGTSTQVAARFEAPGPSAAPEAA